MSRAKHGLTKPVDWFSLFWANKGYLALIAALGLFGLTLVSVASYRDAAEMDRSEELITAQIVEESIAHDAEVTDYYLTFAYSPPLASLRIERKVSKSFYRAHPVGSPAQIRYLPRKPAKFETFVGQFRRNAQWTQVIALIAGLAGCLALWFAGSRANSAVLSRRYGPLVTGEVRSFQEHTYENGNKTGNGTMTWKDPDGRSGQSLIHSM